MTADSSEPGDKTLLLRWKGGQQDAAEEFHRRYVEKLLSLIQKNIARRFSSRFEPADVIQSVMLSFFGAVADGLSIGLGAQWRHCCARRCCTR